MPNQLLKPLYSFLLVILFSCVHDPVTSPIELASELSYSPDSLHLEYGSLGNSGVPNLKGTAPFTFELTSLPDSEGIIVIDAQGMIQVTDTLEIGTYSLNVIVKNSAGAVTFEDVFSIRIFDDPEPPSQLLYSPSSANLLAGNSFSSTIPEIQGRSPFSYSINQNPAQGFISIDEQGIISSTQDLTDGTYILNVDVSNTAGTVTFNSAFTITVSTAASPPSDLLYSVDSLSLIVGTSASSVTPSISGTSPFTYSLSSNPNAGSAISIDANGIITASSSLALGSYDISVSVGNSVDTVNFASIYTVIVNPVPPVTFLNNVRPLIQQRCGSCHTGGSQINFTVYANASSEINNILDRVQRTPGSSGFMPQSGSPLSSAQIQLLQDWLAQGLLP